MSPPHLGSTKRLVDAGWDGEQPRVEQTKASSETRCHLGHFAAQYVTSLVTGHRTCRGAKAGIAPRASAGVLNLLPTKNRKSGTDRRSSDKSLSASEIGSRVK
jgi:hypothetical protein